MGISPKEIPINIKNMKYFIIIICFCSFALENINGQNFNLIITTENVRYDSLYIYGFDVHKNKKIYSGSNINEEWHFSIPDSIAYVLNTYSITPRLFDAVTKTTCCTSFVSLDNRDTLTAEVLAFDKQYPKIRLRYIETKLNSSSFLIRERDSVMRINGFVKEDIFSILLQKDSESYILMKYPQFSRFIDSNYNSCIEAYKEIVSQHPNSYYLMSELCHRVGLYNDMKTVHEIYEIFNPAIQDSYYGKKTYTLLKDTIFTNRILHNDRTKLQERIIEDSTKYNLVVFSASWCGPCRRQIPLLKTLYHKTFGELIMTYVSLDDNNTIEAWRALLKKENIPWRSLSAPKGYEELRDDFHIAGPCIMMISPHMRVKKVYVDNVDDVSKIERLIRN